MCYNGGKLPKVGNMSQARVLYDLQQIDTAIRTGKQRLGEVLRLQKEPAELTAARERAAAADAELQRRRARQRDLALETASVVEKATRSEQRLYSGLVKNPKELSDLQHEVEALSRRKVALEEESLRVLESVDEALAVKKSADAETAELSSRFETSSAALKAEQQTLAINLNRLMERRAQQVKLPPPRMLEVYEQLSRQKNGLAVAGLRGGKCQGCQVTVSASTARAAEEGKLVYCDSCGRLLCPV